MDFVSAPLKRLTSASLRSRKLEPVLPEYYQLENFTENNGWHSTEPNVLEHCLRVFEGVEFALNFDFLSSEARSRLSTFFNQDIDGLSRRELLLAGAWLHDIAKGQTLVKKPDGTTMCPGHEVVGSELMKSFQHRLGLTDDQFQVVHQIVLMHGVAHEFASLAAQYPDQEPQLYSVLKTTLGLNLVSALLIVYSDTVYGSDVKTSDPDEFIRRPAQVIKWLELESSHL